MGERRQRGAAWIGVNWELLLNGYKIYIGNDKKGLLIVVRFKWSHDYI